MIINLEQLEHWPITDLRRRILEDARKSPKVENLVKQIAQQNAAQLLAQIEAMLPELEQQAGDAQTKIQPAEQAFNQVAGEVNRQRNLLDRTTDERDKFKLEGKVQALLKQRDAAETNRNLARNAANSAGNKLSKARQIVEILTGI